MRVEAPLQRGLQQVAQGVMHHPIRIGCSGDEAALGFANLKLVVAAGLPLTAAQFFTQPHDVRLQPVVKVFHIWLAAFTTTSLARSKQKVVHTGDFGEGETTMPPPARPPVLTLLEELLHWTMSRAADFPKAHRGTLTERLINHTLDALDTALDAAFRPVRRIETKQETLHELNLLLEKLRVLWRIIHGRQFISQQQLFFVISKLDEIGRMTGGWIKSLNKREG